MNCDACGRSLRGAGYEHASRTYCDSDCATFTGSIRLDDWLDQGAPGYPDGEHHARLVWHAVRQLRDEPPGLAPLRDVPDLDDEITLDLPIAS